MRGKKGAVWAVVISAILITAGLIPACGNGDGTAAKCQRACEVFDDCGLIPGEDFGDTVAECVDGCKAETTDLTPQEFEEAVTCLENTPCNQIDICMEENGNGDGISAKCQRACEVFDECEWIVPGGDFGGTMAECVDGCTEEMDLTPEEFEEAVTCMETTSCENIEAVCMEGID